MEFPKELIENIIYLDNAATVYPKPREVMQEAMDLYGQYGVNPGRSGFDLCLVGGNLLQETREILAKFFGAKNPERLCFAYNASDALNTLINGIVDDGDHVITTTLEHNSVIRPLNHMQRDRNVTVDFTPFGADGLIDPEEISARITPKTKAVIINHGSNVIGTIQDLAAIGAVCREKGVVFIVDTAQTAGVVPIHAMEMGIDALAFTGHKSLLGPTGIGGLWVREGVEVKHTRTGGTGVKSAYPYHLDEYPYRLEVGTPNLLGVMGLYTAQKWIAGRGLENIYKHEMALYTKLHNALMEIDNVHLHGSTILDRRLPVLSLTIDGYDPADIGMLLDVDYNIAVRTGLQCAPLVHEQMGTSPRGTARMSIGPLNVEAHIDAAIAAIQSIASTTP